MTTTQWFRLLAYHNSIDPVRAVKFTDKTVTLLEPGWGDVEVVRRHPRGQEYFPTFDEAHDALMGRLKQAYSYNLREGVTLANELKRCAKLTAPVQESK